MRRDNRNSRGMRARAFAPAGRVPRAVLAVLLALGPVLSAAPAALARSAPSWRGVYWGESSAALLRHFGRAAVGLPRPIDFGDSYAAVVLPDAVIAGYRVVVFFQMDRRTHGLKRIQTEWPRHSANPPASRALLAALEAAYGRPDGLCDIRPQPANGFQAEADVVWRRRGDAIRAVFRDTTLEAVEGCLGEMTMPCGLVGQLLLRISPLGAAGAGCPLG